MKAKVIGAALAAVVLAGWSAGTARADFVLDGTRHLDVTTSQTQGVLLDNSSADVLAGGYIGRAYVNDNSLLTVKRPSSDAIEYAYLYNNGRMEVFNGYVRYLYAYGTSTVATSGGSFVYHLYANDTTSVAISGGGFGELYAYDTSTMDISGGSVADPRAYGTSTVAISGGSLSYLRTFDNSTVAISGGSLLGLYAYGTSTVAFSGGGLSYLRTYDNSTVTFYGYDFRAGGGLTLDGDKVLGTGILIGRWYGQDDTLWAIPISYHDTGATIRIVPEPATLSLLALGGLAVLRRRRMA